MKGMMRYMAKWTLRENNIELANNIAKEYDIDTLTTLLLLNRGYDKEDIYNINFNINSWSNNETLINIDLAVEKIKKYINNKNAEIWIFADYDCDGLNSGYIMHNGIKNICKCKVHTYYPVREEGYGINIDFCRFLVSKGNKDILVITVDNGISKLEEVEYLKSNNIDILLTDHHPCSDIYPDCLIVNPNGPNKQESLSHLCGTSVAAKVIERLYKELNIYNEEFFIKEFYPHIAIATISDIMPLTKENIYFINKGFEVINKSKNKAWINSLLEGKIITKKEVEFNIGPMLNACGRMGNTKLGAEFLNEKDEDEIFDIYTKIKFLNTERQQLTKNIMEGLDKISIILDNIIIISKNDLPIGLIGAIAGRVADAYKRPCIVLSNSSGSGRSYNGLPLKQIISKALEEGLVESFGGHEEALGIRIKKDAEKNLAKFINKEIEDILSSMPIDEIDKEDEITIDYEISISDINKNLFQNINIIPYKKDEEPIFVLDDVEVVEVIETKNNKDNVWLKIKDNKTIKLFYRNANALIKDKKSGDKVSLVGKIIKNFMNVPEYTFEIIDVK